MKKELDDAEKGKSYSKYFYRAITAPPAKIINLLEAGPISSADALPIDSMNALLNPGYLKTETGYCVMPDKSGFIAVLTMMPGVTGEMFDWWFAWHGLEGLRYKLWYNVDHFDISVDKPGQLLNPKLSYRQRNWGVTHFPVEDIGGGTVELYISFMSPEDCGFDMTRFKSPAVETAVCANVGLNNSEKTPLCVLVHFLRYGHNGMELRSRFWPGYQIINRIPQRLPELTVTEDFVRSLSLHCTKEFTNLASLLPHIYMEEHRRFKNGQL